MDGIEPIVDRLRKRVDKQRQIALLNAKIDETDTPVSKSPKQSKMKQELKDNRDYMFKSDGEFIKMDSEYANKGK